LTPIVIETEEIPNRRNSPLNSRARFSDGSEMRFFGMGRKNTLLDQRITIAQNNRLGVRYFRRYAFSVIV
jgi:hypothetical protein